MKFTLPLDISNMDITDPDTVRVISVTFGEIIRIINGNIGLVDNLDTGLISVTFNQTNTQQAVPHLLHKIPTGYFQIGAKVACQVYDGTQANTNTAIYLKCTVATTVRLLVF